MLKNTVNIPLEKSKIEGNEDTFLWNINIDIDKTYES